MKYNIICGGGALCAVLAGLSFLVMTAGHVLALTQITVVTMALGSLLAALAVPAISITATDPNRKAACVLIALGCLGYITMIVASVRGVAFLGLYGGYGYFAFASLLLVGVYLIIINVLSLRRRIWPRIDALLGVVCGIGYCLLPFFRFLFDPLSPLLGLSPADRGFVAKLIGWFSTGERIVIPIWFIWTGLWLARHGGPEREQKFHWIKWAFAVVGGLVILFGIMSWIAGVKAERELDACLAEVKSQGAVLKLGDLRSPRPAGTQFFEGAAEESALGLLLAKKAESMSDGPRKTRTLVTTVFEHSPHECEMARDLLREKRELINDIKEISVLPPTGMEDILRLTGMREAPFLVRLPNLLTCRYFVNLLVLDACVAYEEGRPDDALASCAHILRLGRHVQDIPSVLCLTMGSALQGVGVDFLTKIIVDANFSEDAMQSFSELLDPADTRESLAMAYAGELVVFRQHFARWPLRVPFVRFITAADEKAWIVILSEASRNARLPYYKADNDGLLQENQDLIGWNTPIARVGIPNVLKAKRVQAFMELELIQLRVALAVNRCKRDTGAYPESASTLVPKYLETTTINPLTGKPVELEYMNAEAAKKKREDDSHRYRRFFTVGGPRSDKRLLID